MHQSIETVPCATIEPVTEIIHGAPVTDPYRWLEQQDSPRTREWIDEQTRYARAYLDGIPNRSRVKQRIRELLSVVTYDSLQMVGNGCVFRKRLADQEQPCICIRESPEGEDHVLVDPAARGTGEYTAARPLFVSWDGRLLLYEIKQGGELSGTFEIIDIQTHRKLVDGLPRGFLHGFAFTPDSKGYFYVHRSLDAHRPHYAAVYHHILGSDTCDDTEVFVAGEDPGIRLILFSSKHQVGFLVNKFGDKCETDFYVQSFDRPWFPLRIVDRAQYIFRPIFFFDRLFATTDKDAPNMRVIEVLWDFRSGSRWREIVPETDARISKVAIASEKLFVSYVKGTSTRIAIHSTLGETLGQIPVNADETVSLINNPLLADDLLCESESFTRPLTICRYLPSTKERKEWIVTQLPFDGSHYESRQVYYTSKDGLRIPMFLVARHGLLDDGVAHPAILTSYGGFGTSMTPQFSVFVAFLMERGCIFALPNIRGGSEFGAAWHEAGKRRNRQNAYDDFLLGAEWLIQSGHTTPNKLAIFGGSNSGLLVGVAMTQRPDLFRAVVCLVPLLDMLRYHLFDFANAYIEEYGTADNPDDFVILSGYSPYHQLRSGTNYPAVLIISGDADGNCNALHARKMTARLQAANSSLNPILLDYKRFRGHSPVLPLSERIEGLTDRLAFLCDQLELAT
jgi:prolyl oligopeptidase